MSEGKGSPEIEPIKSEPSGSFSGALERKTLPDPSPQKLGFNPSLPQALERIAGVDPRVASLMQRAVQETVVPKAEHSSQVVDLEDPRGGRLSFDPAHPMSEKPESVIASADIELKKPKQPRAMMDGEAERLRNLYPGHPEWDGLTDEQQRQSRRLRREAARARRPENRRGFDPADVDYDDGEGLPAAPIAPERVRARVIPPGELGRLMEVILPREGEVGLERSAERLSAAKKALREYYKLPSTERILKDRRGALITAQEFLIQYFSEAPRQHAEGTALKDQMAVLVGKIDWDWSTHRDYEEVYKRVNSLRNEDGTVNEAQVDRIRRDAKNATSAEGARFQQFLVESRGGVGAGRGLDGPTRQRYEDLAVLIEEANSLRNEDGTVNEAQVDRIRRDAQVKAATAGDKFQLFLQWRDLNDHLERHNHANPFESGAHGDDDVYQEMINSIPEGESVPKFEELVGDDLQGSMERRGEIEAYLLEAKKRGYLDDLVSAFGMWESIARQSAENLNILTMPDDPSLPEEVRASRNAVRRALQAASENFSAKLAADKEGTPSTAGRSDADNFMGLAAFYLKEGKAYLEGKYQTRSSHGKRPDYEPKFAGLYRRSDEQRHWELTYANYYNVTASTVEELGTALDTFFGSQTVDSPVHKSANDIFSQINAFTAAITTVQDRIIARETEGLEGTAKLHKIEELTEEIKEMVARMQLQFVAFSCYSFGKLGETGNFINMFKHIVGSQHGMEILNSARDIEDGRLMLASRMMQTREWTTIFRDEGENGGILNTDYHLRIASEMRSEMAEEIMLYEANDVDPVTGRASEETKKANLRRLGNFQMGEKFDPQSEQFKILFKKNEVIADILRKKSEGIRLTPGEEETYGRALARAKSTVEFAYQMEGALGDLSIKAGPAYKVRVYKRDEEGHLLNAEGEPLRKHEPHKLKGSERLLAWIGLRKTKHHDEGYANGEPAIERMDFMPKESQLGFVLTAEAVAQIRGANMRVRIPDTRPGREGKYRVRRLNAKEVEQLATQARARAYMDIEQRGFGARLTDENGQEIKFALNPDTGQIDLNTAGLRHDGKPILCHSVKDVGVKPIMLEVNGVEEDTSWGNNEDIADRVSMNFDQVSEHYIGKAPDATYFGAQHEKFRQLFTSEVYQNALDLRSGKKNIEQAGFMAHYLLMLDPSLRRIRKPEVLMLRKTHTDSHGHSTVTYEEATDEEENDKIKKQIVNIQTGWNHQRRLRAQRELRRRFIGVDGSMDGIYYGPPNMTFVTYKLAHAAEREGTNDTSGVRRGKASLWYSPDSFRTLSQMYGGQGLDGLLSVINLESSAAHTLMQEAIDTNVLSGWGDFLQACDNLHIALYGGTKDGKNYVPLYEKLTADADAAITILSKTESGLSAESYDHIKTLLNFLKRFGVVLESMREVETVSRGGGGERHIEGVDLFKKVKGKGLNGEIIEGEVFASEKEIGSITDGGRISETEFSGNYFDTLIGPVGKALYPHEQPLMASLLLMKYETVTGSKISGIEWTDSKLIR
jgi:hypothetical protein